MARVPEQYNRTFFNNAEAFRKAWIEELELKSLLSNKLKMTASVEGNGKGQGVDDEYVPDDVRNIVVRIYNEQALPIRVDEDEFKRSMFEIDTILVTLRIFRENGDIQIIGYAKGYPLEKSKLRRGTADENFRKNNTA